MRFLIYFAIFIKTLIPLFAKSEVEQLSKIAEYEHMITEFEKSGNKTEVAFYLGKIGAIYAENKQPDNAIKYYKKCLAIYEKIQKPEEVANCKINIAAVYTNTKKYSKAIKPLEEALEISHKIKDENLIKNCYKALADNYEKLGDKKNQQENLVNYQAYEKLKENEELKQKNRDKAAELEIVKSKARLSEIQKNSKELELAKERVLLKEATVSLAEAEEKNKEIEVAIDLLNKEKELIDITLKEQQARIENRELTLKEQETRLEKESLLRNSILVGFLFTLIFVFVLYRGYKEKKVSEELIKEQNHKIISSINYAQRIQEAMLPKETELHRLLPDSFIFFKPREVVSGDFYWFAENNKNIHEHQYRETEELDNDGYICDELIITAVDCTGHGVPGAFMSMIGYNLLNNIVSRGIVEADLILNELHRGVRHSLKQYKTDNKDGMDMALCVIKKQERLIEFSGAKNSLVYIQNGQLIEIKADKFGIGGFQKENQREFTKHRVQLDSPAVFYMFTDGFADQFGGIKNKKFMIRNLKELLVTIHEKPMNEQRDILNQTLETWRGVHKQLDDVLIIGFKI